LSDFLIYKYFVWCQLCAFFGLSNIVDDQWDGLVYHDQLQLIRQAVRQVLDSLRPNAVSLVDAFDIPG
jgi:hypothetical protein